MESEPETKDWVNVLTSAKDKKERDEKGKKNRTNKGTKEGLTITNRRIVS